MKIRREGEPLMHNRAGGYEPRGWLLARQGRCIVSVPSHSTEEEEKEEEVGQGVLFAGGSYSFSLEDAPWMMRLTAIQDSMKELRELINRQKQTTVAEITSLAPHPFIVIKPIKAVIRPTTDGSYLATFYDAGIVASGESELLAFDMLRESIAIAFRVFVENKSNLGRIPQRQFAVLSEFIAESITYGRPDNKGTGQTHYKEAKGRKRNPKKRRA